jgi:hypothetical protein
LIGKANAGFASSKIIFANVFDWTAKGGPMLAKPAQKLLDLLRFFYTKSQLSIKNRF